MSDRLDFIVAQDAALLANSLAKERIPSIGMYNTDVFDPHSGLEGTAISLRMRLDYSSNPELHQQLKSIANEALRKSLRKHAAQYAAEALSRP